MERQCDMTAAVCGAGSYVSAAVTAAAAAMVFSASIVGVQHGWSFGRVGFSTGCLRHPAVAWMLGACIVSLHCCRACIFP